MFTMNCKGRMPVADKPLVMGIINVTTNSFYKESRILEINHILEKVEIMLKDGADIIDIGGQSTRPGSEKINAGEELQRVIPAIEAIKNNFSESYVSVDSFYSKVARAAVAAGADIINDISAGNFDSEMIATVAELNVPYIIMHIKGEPKTMQSNPQYQDVTREVLDFLISKCYECKMAGINDVIIDPGIGFGKTIQQNFELLRNLEVFKIIDCPLLLGVSRKSLIYKTLGITPEEALNGTTVLNSLGLLKGAAILRVHDVKEASQVVRLYLACTKFTPGP